MDTAIGFMIGAYIITRMVEMLTDKQISGLLAICAGVTIVVVLVGMFSMVWPIDAILFPAL